MQDHADGQVAAIVPLNALGRAKSRLAAVVDPAARRELAAALATRVIGACQQAEPVGRVLVVAGDDAAADVAYACGAAAVIPSRPGLAAAMTAADDALADASATLVVAGDLPQLTVADVDAVCRAGTVAPCVVVAPTHDGGTGALLRRPPAVTATAFGPGSAAAHRDLAARAGASVAVVHRPGLAYDVDVPADLRHVPDPRLRALLSPAGHAREGAPLMPQANVADFDLETGKGSLLTDDGRRIELPAEAFHASGLRELRLGQRVRYEAEGSGDDERVTSVQLVSL